MTPLERERLEAAAIAFALVSFLIGFIGLTVWAFYQ